MYSLALALESMPFDATDSAPQRGEQKSDKESWVLGIGVETRETRTGCLKGFSGRRRRGDERLKKMQNLLYMCKKTWYPKRVWGGGG